MLAKQSKDFLFIAQLIRPALSQPYFPPQYKIVQDCRTHLGVPLRAVMELAFIEIESKPDQFDIPHSSRCGRSQVIVQWVNATPE